MESARTQSWILGTSGLRRIQRLEGAFQAKILGETVGYGPDKTPVQYTPWFQLLRIGKKGVVYGPDRQGPSKLITERAHLELIADLVSGPGGAMVSLGVDQAAFAVFTDIERQFPQAQEFVQSCLEPVFRESPWLSDLYDSIVHELIPIQLPQQDMRAGFSSLIVRGVIFAAIPPEMSEKNLVKTAVDIIHELGHQALMIYQAADPIIASDPNEPVYSGVKRVHRPAIMSFHAAVALAYMMTAMNIFMGQKISHATKVMLQEMFDEQSEALRLTLLDLNKVCDFTQLGKKLMDDMQGLLDGEVQNMEECV